LVSVKGTYLATSIFDAAAKFASAIGVPIIGIVSIKVGWRWSFAATGLISFLYFLLFCRVYRDPDDDPALSGLERDYLEQDADNSDAGENDAAKASSFGHLLKQSKMLGMAIGFGSYNYVFYLLLTWLPSYLSIALHIDLPHSFLYTSVPWLAATVTDVLVDG
jgi:ACS family D-galactonate transporter-like MFS transporter